MEKEKFIEIVKRLVLGVADEQDLKIYNSYFNAYQNAFSEWDKLNTVKQEHILATVKFRVTKQILQKPVK